MMETDPKIIVALLSLVSTLVVTLALLRWRKSKGRTSVFATDTSLEDIGLSAISALGDTRSPNRIDGYTELRPTWGSRIFGPAIAFVVLLNIEATQLFEALGIFDNVIQFWIICALFLLLTYTVIQLNVFQRVVYNTTAIACVGIDVRRQDRSLTELIDIKVHDKRPALVLTFVDQPTLYIPKFISQRARFISDMEAIITANRARGLSVPPEGLVARMGF